MKNLITIVCLLATATCFAQKEYKASNGKIYHVGDTVIMSKGSGVDGKFKSLARTGLSAMASYNSNNPNGADQLLASSYFSNGKGIIKKIKEMKFAGNFKPYFILDFNQGGNYMLLVEDAISACEILPCKKLKKHR